MSRTQAFGLHLVASLAVFFSLLGILILAWYPGPLYELEGGWARIPLVAIAAVVLGPILTLVLFKPGKPGLKLDMALIVLFQVSALSWGVYSLYEARPTLMVFADESFRTFTHAQIAGAQSGGLGSRAGESITKVYVDLPDDPAAYARLLGETRAEGRSVHLLHERYEPLEESWARLEADSLDIEHYVSGRASWQRELDELTESLGAEPSELVFLPYVGRYDRTILVASPESKRLVGVLDIPYDPGIARKRVPRSKRAGGGG